MSALRKSNPYVDGAIDAARRDVRGRMKAWASDAPAGVIATAILTVGDALLALAFEQHQRNRLAAITAREKGLPLPDDLAALAAEGAAPAAAAEDGEAA
ncbi:hypothetical protein ACXET9_07095 [Brachybacterium sp. DNPG3]